LNHPLCKGIAVLQPSRFYSCTSGRDHFKAVRRLDIWKLALCLQNLWFISVKKLATFGYVVDAFSHGNKLILRILNWSAKENKTLSMSDQWL